MTGPIKAGLIAVGPVLNTVGFAVTGSETRLTLEMTLPQAELVLARLVRAAASARVAAGTAKWRSHLRGLASLTCFSPNTVHFAIRMATATSIHVVGCGVRGRSG